MHKRSTTPCGVAASPNQPVLDAVVRVMFCRAFFQNLQFCLEELRVKKKEAYNRFYHIPWNKANLRDFKKQNEKNKLATLRNLEKSKAVNTALNETRIKHENTKRQAFTAVANNTIVHVATSNMDSSDGQRSSLMPPDPKFTVYDMLPKSRIVS